MKFVVNVGYKTFEFDDCNAAVEFALTAINSQKDTTDEVAIEFIKEEE